MMSALVEVDGERVTRYAREHDLATEEALPRLLEETLAAARRAGRDVVEAGGQKLHRTHAEVVGDRPATVIAGVYFTGERDAANLVFDRWNEALAQRATILRTFLRGEETFREWIDEGFQKEVDDVWTPEKEQEIRQLIDSTEPASAERARQLRTWWRDWGQAYQHPWRTRVLLAVSLAFFGLIVGAPLARADAAWPLLLAVLVGALLGLALAEYGIRVSKRTAAASADPGGILDAAGNRR